VSPSSLNGSASTLFPASRMICPLGIYLPVADRNLATTSAGTRPRSLMSNPFALAQSRISVVLSPFAAALAVFRAGRRLVPVTFRAASV
jgi:hypothetical protein